MSYVLIYSTLIGLCTSVFNVIGESSNCTVLNGAYDLSQLDGTWLIVDPLHLDYEFHISLCQPLRHESLECSNSSVCMSHKNYNVSNLGNYMPDIVAVKNPGGFSLFFHSDKLCENQVARSNIQFMCGPHLGSPKLVMFKDCVAYFQWKSFVACDKPPLQKEVPCYLYDYNKNKIDLTPLIKQEGGYTVNYASKERNHTMILNVCANLPKGVNCSNSSAACEYTTYHMISYDLSTGLKFEEGKVVLEYINTESDNPIKAKIIFSCPDRMNGQSPYFLYPGSFFNTVFWPTEYACPEHILKGDFNTCSFTKAGHGVNIDLSPLKIEGGYSVKGHINGSEVNFIINVCGSVSCGLGNALTTKRVTACLQNSMANNTEVIGTKTNYELKYADSSLSLMYEGHALCEGGMKVSTLINFICDSGTKSNITHVYSDDCIHVFELRSEHACVNTQPEVPCVAMKGDQAIDLGSLSLEEGQSWFVASEEQNADFFLNICKHNAFKCGSGASACKIDKKENQLNLGQFVSAPVYNPEMNAVILNYTNGSSCNGTTSKNWSTSIYFKCKPGHLMTTPVVINVDEESCHYDFEWHTAEACPSESFSGTGCQIYSAESGISFDLSPLKSSTYHTESILHRYYISICEAFVNSSCSKDNPGKSIGACQVSKNNESLQTAVIGEVTDVLQYKNGMISLVYPYQNGSTIIIFICSDEAVTGKLEFVRPLNGSFMFYFYTNLVCNHKKAMDCVVQNNRTGEVYDLSSLIRSDENWVTYHNDSDGVKKSYINVCKPIVPVANCNKSASLCIVDASNGTEVPYVKNAGTTILHPELSSDGVLQLQYSSGDDCVAFGQAKNYSSYMHFQCPKSKEFSEGPRYLGMIGKCIYTYLWTTHAACPIKRVTNEGYCFVRDPESGFVFDLSPLTKHGKPYSVTSGNNTYQLNICEAVKEGCTTSNNTVAATNASVCMISNDGHSVSTLAVSDYFALRYIKGFDLQLVYKHDNKSRPGFLNEVIITFPCTKNHSGPQLKFLRQEGHTYFFEMATDLTCMPKPFVCQFQDSKGNEYDLSPLAMKYGFNWVASDRRKGSEQFRYHITFCHPLNRISKYKCPVGVAACKIDVAGEPVGMSLGTQLSTPLVNEHGVVSVVYNDGDPCPRAPVNSSARINIFCTRIEGHLTFVEETADCEYIFSLNSPAACPLQTRFGNECSVADPNYGYKFDLSPLKNWKQPSVLHGEYLYLLSVCKPLDVVSGDCVGSAACQTKPGENNFTKSLGMPSRVLKYDRGVITLKYESGSGKCHDRFNRSTIITFTCDHNATALEEAPSFISESEDCAYMFEWPTTYACPPFDFIDCSVRDDDGHLFDLSPLSLTSGNYYVKNPYIPNGTFVLNVCRSIVHTPDSMCLYSAAACIVNPHERSTNYNRINIGEARQGPYFDEGKLKLKYTAGQHCDVIGSTSLFMETVIEFTCDEMNVFSQPQFVGQDKCTYYFDWSTAYACHFSPQVSSNNCTVTDPVTGLTFDLNPLKSDAPYVVQNRNHFFHLSICEPLSNSSCGLESGVCQEEIDGQKRKFNAGTWNSELKYEEEILFLNYTGGQSCHGGKYHRNTIIHFRCGKGIGKPEFLHESSECAYYFVWKTELACQFLVQCALQNESHHIDLSPLSLSPFLQGDSLMVSDNAEYYFRICGPLGSIPGVHCPPSSSICRVSEDGTAESLGLVHIAPFHDFNGTSSMIFINGSSCGIDGEKKRSRIQFICDRNEGLGVPTLVDIIGKYCTYVFQWKTSVICPSKIEEPVFNSCTYKDEGKGIYFNLSSLRSPTSYEVQNTNSHGSFMVNICGTVSSSKQECSGAGICFQSNNSIENYGMASTHSFSYDGKRLRAILSDGSDCPSGNNGKRSSQIFFVCHPFAGVGRPVLYKQYTCSVVFMWETNLVCRNVEHQCAFDVGGSFYDLHLLSSLSHNWNFTDPKGNMYWLNLCRGIFQNAETSGCPQSAAVCMRGLSGVHMPLGMVYTLKAKKTGSSLLLIYKSFNNLPCSSLPSPGLNATARVNLTCGSTLGSPKLISGPDSSCNYDFSWVTSLVCSRKPVELKLNEKGLLYEDDLKYEMDVNPILHKTFEAIGTSHADVYKYLINFDGVYKTAKQPDNACKDAAICQSKPSDSFFRDIGSVGTQKFYKIGSELHLTLTSQSGKCGKKANRNVTSIINLSCSTAHESVGEPVFVYESTGCDYIFSWDTYVVCPSFHRPDDDGSNTIEPDAEDHSSAMAPVTSHKAGIVISFLFLACLGCYVIFVLSKAERRAAMASKFRICFSRVSIPRFRYKRYPGESISLVDDLSKNSNLNEDENNLL